MKNIALFLLIALFAVSCEKEVVTPEYDIPGLVKLYKESPSKVTDYMVKQALQKQLDAMMFAPAIEMQSKGTDSTFNAVFKVMYAGTIPPANVVHWIQTRLLIGNGNLTPNVHSMSFVLQGSQGVVFPAAAPGVIVNGNSSFITFPSGYIMYNAIGNRFFFVFFSLNPITMDWVDKVICLLAVQAPSGQSWITVDRSQNWYFALSEDGYNDYLVYFYPDTLRF